MVARPTTMNQLNYHGMIIRRTCPQWVPHPGPQAEFEVFFGGVPGGGMADCILSLPAKKIGKSENEK